MTAGTNTGDGFSCHNCAHHTRSGDRFCERCGSELGVRSAPWQSVSGDGQPHVSQRAVDATSGPISDGTTRYLCAAAHLDEAFCDEAITEFLVEPVRAIPPSPGVDSAAVLREVVAAQTRRRIRNGVLLALLLMLALVNLTAVIFWTVVAVGATQLLPTGVSRNRRMVSAVFVVAGVALAAMLVLPMLLQLAISDGLGGFATPELLSGRIGPTLLISGLMLVVLIVDEFTVAKLNTSSFRRDRFDPDAGKAPSEWERLVRSLGRHSFRAELARVARSDESSQAAGQADVVVYRGYTPFIGAGEPVHHQVIALPLEPGEGENDTNPVPIGVNDLHRHVAEGIAALRSASSLGPGRRLEQLRQREQVLMPADRLLFQHLAQMQPPVLPDLSRPALAHLPLGAARALAEDPLEWARYYNCFRIESWDRDLTTSCYLHIGTDQSMLYLEWTYCILFPVAKRYRSIDHVVDSPWTTFGRSLFEWAVFPASALRRLRSVFRTHTALVQGPGELIPARYGAAHSLRELAADTEAQTYFQDADIERYVNIMDRALVRAVGQYLEERGYSVVEFMRMADPVTNNFNIQGDAIGSAFGRNSKVGDVRVNAARAGGTKGAK